MRIPTETEYATAKAALAVYADFSKPYVQRNGWTVIPADAPRPTFDGAPLDTDRVNAVGDRLSAKAGECPSIYVYLGDDGKVYVA